MVAVDEFAELDDVAGIDGAVFDGLDDVVGSDGERLQRGGAVFDGEQRVGVEVGVEFAAVRDVADRGDVGAETDLAGADDRLMVLVAVQMTSAPLRAVSMVQGRTSRPWVARSCARWVTLAGSRPASRISRKGLTRAVRRTWAWACGPVPRTARIWASGRASNRAERADPAAVRSAVIASPEPGRGTPEQDESVAALIDLANDDWTDICASPVRWVAGTAVTSACGRGGGSRRARRSVDRPWRGAGRSAWGAFEPWSGSRQERVDQVTRKMIAIDRMPWPGQIAWFFRENNPPAGTPR